MPDALYPRAVLTGAPGAGKTALLDAAARAGIRTSPEIARALLKRAGGMELRAEEPVRFARAMADMHVAELNRFAALDGPVLFDRGLPDVVGFLDVSGLPVPDALHRACIKLRYSGPILRAPPWQAIYRQDDERIQTFAQAVESDRAVILAWRRYGYDPVDLPLAPIAERLAFVKSALAV